MALTPPQHGPQQDSDAAWATVELPVPPRVVSDLLGDPALLLRLNPCLTFEKFDRLDGGKMLRMTAYNESNACRVETDVQFVMKPDLSRVSMRYLAGIKRETRFAVEPLPGGSQLTITEVYSPPPVEPAAEHLAAVDRSLLPWTAAIRRHLERQVRYGLVPGYRWLSRRFWPSMSPQQRRIGWLIIWTTAVEFVVFSAVLAVYLSAGK